MHVRVRMWGGRGGEGGERKPWVSFSNMACFTGVLLACSTPGDHMLGALEIKVADRLAFIE